MLIENMRRFFLIALLLAATATTTIANPIVELPKASMLAIPIVVFAALVVETGVVALILTFKGLLPLRVFYGYGVTNLAVYLLLFLPLLIKLKMPIILLEALVVVSDAICIKLITSIDNMQGDDYQGVGWRYAFLTACAGNTVSVLVGLSMKST
jgi:hypothetical protein